MLTLRESKWTFETSNGGNIAAGLIAAEGGSITLKDPSGRPVRFYYGALGVGVGVGASLPKIGKYKVPPSSGSSESMPSTAPYISRQSSNVLSSQSTISLVAACSGRHRYRSRGDTMVTSCRSE